MTKKVILLYLTVVLTGILFVSIPASASDIASPICDNLKGCEKKFCEIERQLKIAQEKGNKSKEKGLRKSLENANEHCTDKGLKEDLIKEIEEANEEIAEYELGIKEAKEKGKTGKIRKYQEKIKEEQNKINLLEAELSHFD